MKNLKNILSCCPHPGTVNMEIVKTEGMPFLIKTLIYFLGNPFMYLFFKTEYMGAQCTLHCCYINRDEFKNGG